MDISFDKVSVLIVCISLRCPSAVSWDQKLCILYNEDEACYSSTWHWALEWIGLQWASIPSKQNLTHILVSFPSPECDGQWWKHPSALGFRKKSSWKCQSSSQQRSQPKPPKQQHDGTPPPSCAGHAQRGGEGKPGLGPLASCLCLGQMANLSCQGQCTYYTIGFTSDQLMTLLVVMMTMMKMMMMTWSFSNKAFTKHFSKDFICFSSLSPHFNKLWSKTSTPIS